MSSKPNWDFAKQAVESNDEYADVTPGRVAKPRERIPGHDETTCAACGGVVKISNFICPHCNGKVRAKPQPAGASMASCWECKKEIGKSAKTCPHCGANQKKKPLAPAPMWFMVCFFGAILAVIAFAVIKGQQLSQEEQQWRQFEDELREKYGDK
jgi:hypothetical protein